MFRVLFNKKIIFLVMADILTVILAYLISYYFVTGKIVVNLFSMSVASLIYILFMCAFGIYTQILRYSSIKEYFKCFLASGVSCLLICGLKLTTHMDIPSVRHHLLAGILVSIGFISLRVVLRFIGLTMFKASKGIKHGIGNTKRKRLLVIGAGTAGDMLIKEIAQSYAASYNIIGLIDDDENKKGFTISGIKVLGGRYKIIDICKSYKVDLILLAIPSISGEDKKEIIDICHKTGVKLRVLPSLGELAVGGEIIKKMRDPSIEDLLPRDPVKLDNDKISTYIKDKVVMVTGGGGSIGSELCRQIVKFSPKQLIILDIYENNAYDIECELKSHYPSLNLKVVIASVRDKERLCEVFEEFKPNMVFHAAAHKHVPLMENNSSEAIKNNVIGTLNVADCADKYGVTKFIMISTDKAVNPTNVMGATKRICEMIIQGYSKNSKTEFAAVRFGNVLGSNGSVIPLFKRQISEGGPVTITHKEITRFFMTIPEAAQLVLQAASFASGGEIFVLDMGSPVKIYDLAVNMIKLSGYIPNEEIEIKVTGLRPGEKLYEELLMSEEGLTDTQSSKIFIAQPMDIDLSELKKKIAILLDIALDPNRGEFDIKNEIFKIVPTYRPDTRNKKTEEKKTADIPIDHQTAVSL